MKTFLVLERRPRTLLKLLSRTLKEWAVLTARSAEGALRLYHDSGRRIELLVATVTLPTSSGIQVALLLRSEIKDLPVILTDDKPQSTWGERDVADLQRLGTNGVAVIQTPCGADLFLKTVQELVGETSLSRHPDLKTPALLPAQPPEIEMIKLIAEETQALSTTVRELIETSILSRKIDYLAPMLPPLTRRETEVVKLIAEAKTSRQIAETLGMTMKTVASHKGHVMGKLNIHNLAGLVRYAIRSGLVPP